MGSHNPILLEFHDFIAVITLDLPKKLNALTTDQYQLLGKRLREVAARDDILVTVVTGNGRYFSAGIVVHESPEQAAVKKEDARDFWLASFTANNVDVTRAFFQHPKILIAALNGPVVGLSAALIAHCDFIFATEEAFVLAPFVALGLVAEGCSSYTFIRRLGLARANETLLSARKLPSAELLACGFINKVFPSTTPLLPEVLKYARDTWGGKQLNRESVLAMKKLIRMGWDTELEATNIREHFAGLERFANGIPQKEFVSVSSVFSTELSHQRTN